MQCSGVASQTDSVEDFKQEFHKEQGPNVIDMGGITIPFTNPNGDTRNVSIKEQWLKRWFDSVKPLEWRWGEFGKVSLD